MDPNANLAEQLALVKQWQSGAEFKGDTDRLCELVVALHDWIARGGALPTMWAAIDEKKMTV